MGLLELRDGADIARSELLGVSELLPLGYEQLPDPLARVSARVEDLRIRRHRALVDAEQVDLAREGVSERLEDEGDQIGAWIRLERASSSIDGARLDRRREILDEGVEQSVRREVLGRHAAGDRETAGRS